jgi:hypothetical protein
MPDWMPTIIVALVAALPGLYAAFQQRKKLDAEATARIAETAIGLLDDLREENLRLRAEKRDWEIEQQTMHETLMTYIAKIRMLEAERAIGRAVAGKDLNNDESGKDE